MENQILDDNIQIITDEIKKQFAGFWIRVGASLIDFVVYLPFIGLNMYNLYFMKSLPLALAIALILTVYKPFMEFKYGATLGKMAVNIKIVNLEFGKISPGQALLRYSPWLLGQIVSIITYILLYQNPDFINASSMKDVGTLQNEIISPAYTFITGMVLIISCLIVAFNDKKQGLHDMIASTYCVYK